MSDVVHALFAVRSIQAAFVLGALVDVGGGLLLRARSSWTARHLDFPVPPQLLFWPQYASVFLFVLPVFYLVTAIDPVGYLLNVYCAIWGRALGSAFYLRYYFKFPEHRDRKWLLVLAAGNAVFAVWYFGFVLSRAS